LKHDFRREPTGQKAEQFKLWLRDETIKTLNRGHSDMESLKTSMFLFVNRAYEAHMPDQDIAEIIGVAIVRAGYSEAQEEVAFDWLDQFGPIAKATHAGT
jgi:hypothetical protein